MIDSLELRALAPVALHERPAPKLERVFDLDEVAEYLRIKRGSVEWLVRVGKLESFQPYVQRRLVTESQLARFIARASTDPTQCKGDIE